MASQAHWTQLAEQTEQAAWEQIAKRAWLHGVLADGRALEIAKNAGLSYVDVAAYCGVSDGAAWDWLHGRTRPQRANAAALLRRLEQLEAISHRGT